MENKEDKFMVGTSKITGAILLTLAYYMHLNYITAIVEPKQNKLPASTMQKLDSLLNYEVYKMNQDTFYLKTLDNDL